MADRAIGLISQIPKGEGRNFRVNGHCVAVFHTRANEVFATQAECPHLGGPLADGLTDGAAIVCPLHDRTFDLRTGQGIGTDCAIATFPVRLDREGRILLVEQDHENRVT
jgi:nitrite reductase (NADH) small subunit